jgi:hypothetical protein
MSPPLERRVDGVEKAHAARGRVHYFFKNWDETLAQVQARIAARIASGGASPSDQFIIFQWGRRRMMPTIDPAHCFRIVFSMTGGWKIG